MENLNRILLISLILILYIGVSTAQQNETNHAQKHYTVNATQGIGISSTVSGSTYSPSIEKEFKRFTFEIILLGIWLVLFGYVLSKHEEILIDWKLLAKNKSPYYITLKIIISIVWLVGSIVIIWYMANLHSQIRKYF